MTKIFSLLFALALLAFVANPALAVKPSTTGFDEFGYNNTARIFNGTLSGWCLAGGQSANCMGDYSNDKLVMKWNAAWDNCNDNDYNDPEFCAGAWTSNEYNGMNQDGSQSNWHYKIIWVGSDPENSPYWVDGGYAIWGNYEVIMDHGTDTDGHFWFAHGIPNGYGAK